MPGHAITMPPLGRTPTAGTLAEWYRADGDHVSAGEAVVRIECDGVSLELEAGEPGILHQHVAAPSPVSQGQPLADVTPDPGAAPGSGTDSARSGASSAGAPRHMPGTSRPSTLAVQQGVAVPQPAGPASPTTRDRSGWEEVPTDGADLPEWLRDGFIETVESAREAPDDDPDTELDHEHDSDPETEAPKATGSARPPSYLWFRVTAAMNEAWKMREQLAREWRADGVTVGDEDIVLRALARAIDEHDPGLARRGQVALQELGGNSPGAYVVERAARRPFRETVEALTSLRSVRRGVRAGKVVAVMPLSELGIDDAVPPLGPAQPLVLAMGAVQAVAHFDGERVAPRRVAGLTLAYNPTLIPPATAARVLARVKELVESPYALLAH